MRSMILHFTFLILKNIYIFQEHLFRSAILTFQICDSYISDLRFLHFRSAILTFQICDSYISDLRFLHFRSVILTFQICDSYISDLRF
jgi:hypothetical protein